MYPDTIINIKIINILSYILVVLYYGCLATCNVILTGLYTRNLLVNINLVKICLCTYMCRFHTRSVSSQSIGCMTKIH